MGESDAEKKTVSAASLGGRGRRWEPFYMVFLSRPVHHSAIGDMRKESTGQNLIRIRNDPG